MKSKRTKIRMRVSRMKMYAYQIESARRVHCSEVSSAAGLEISVRPAGRRVRKKKSRNDPQNYYFYFLASKGGVIVISHGDAKTTLTHLVLIDLIREVGLLRCAAYTQYGGGYIEDFRACFNRVDLEKTYEEERLKGKDRRRPDITGALDEWSILGIVPTRMLVEVGVTSIIRDYSRYAALTRIGMPCLELLPPRLDHLEAGKPGQLDRTLREMLQNGTIEARWIVDPRLRAATIQDLSTVRAELQGRQSRARERFKEATAEVKKLLHERDSIKPSESAQVLESLQKLDEQLDSIVRRTDNMRRHLREDTSLLRKVLEFAIPPLQKIRYANIDDQMDALLAELRGDPDAKRSGIIGDINRLRIERKRILRKISEASLKVEMAQRAASRIEADANRELGTLDVALHRLRFLHEQGQMNILVLPCQQLEDAVGTEYSRHVKNAPPTLFDPR